MGLQRWWEQEIPVDGTINKGELMTHNLTELIKPESYEVRLTPITRFGEGDSTIRIITYSGECSVQTRQQSVVCPCSENTENTQLRDWVLVKHLVAQEEALAPQPVMLSSTCLRFS